MKTKTIYLEYLEEFKSFGIPKKEIEELKKQGIVADIRFHKELYENKSTDRPTVGFLLGQDKGDNGEEYYTIGLTYAQAALSTGAEIKFLDYESSYQQMKGCDGVILPGGAFDNPEDFFIDGKDMGGKEGKRFFAYKAAITEAHRNHKPMLGICAGAQMIGALLGNMKMYRSIEKEVSKKTVHKPKAETDVRIHGLKLIKGTPIYDIMGLASDEDKIMINSRHNQAMVHPALQDYVEGTPLVKMDMYAVSDADGIPEIWGNETAGILCVQGHPEDLAAMGNQKMQRLYNYIAKKAAAYKRAHPKNKLNLISIRKKCKVIEKP